ncbi:OLC1v1012376C1 [Oldenlandia corymbosa var. corymbosa]|uniref:OLC1v1012376C1 n=1 Tax=Oldenlandia corymbosa var. corymbosa TaxID=529605 RepID=A0AAV1DVT9_OLDCO|nr:OLC1v1012376C1 [Oldenlandia corymbosa var. corymbosa]
MAAERREVNIMSVELAIQRELAYRKRVAGFLSKEEKANLLPLKRAVLRQDLKCDKASELEKDGWKLVKIDEGERIQRPALEGPKLKMQAENGRSLAYLLSSSTIFKCKYKSSSRLTHFFVRKGAMSLPKPGCSKPPSFSNRTIPSANAMPISVPILKTSKAVSTENQKTSQPGIRVHSPRKEYISSLNCLQKPTPYPDAVRDGSLYLFCNLCKVECSGPFSYKQHLKGQKHRSNLRFQPLCIRENSANTAAARKMRNCELCEIWCSDEDHLQVHFKGRKHQENLLGDQKQNSAQEQQQLWCGLCEVPCIDQQSYELHLRGKTHAFHLWALETSSGKEKTNA